MRWLTAIRETQHITSKMVMWFLLKQTCINPPPSVLVSFKHKRINKKCSYYVTDRLIIRHIYDNMHEQYLEQFKDMHVIA